MIDRHHCSSNASDWPVHYITYEVYLCDHNLQPFSGWSLAANHVGRHGRTTTDCDAWRLAVRSHVVLQGLHLLWDVWSIVLCTWYDTPSILLLQLFQRFETFLLLDEPVASRAVCVIVSAACEVMQWIIGQLSPKPQTSESRSSTICFVVERPDHHCGDDLAFNISETDIASNFTFT